MFKSFRNQVSSYQSIIRSSLANVSQVFSHRLDKAPLETVERLVEFIQTRAAYVAQTALYGYLKTRMGTRYPSMFEDEALAQSINIAKWQIYASCLSDLTVFTAATCGIRSNLNDAEISELALFCFKSSIDQTFEEATLTVPAKKLFEQFEERLAKINWQAAATAENAFELSPPDLIRWAPIAEELKNLDRDIVTNSIRFRWRDVREQLRKRIDADAICENLQQIP